MSILYIYVTGAQSMTWWILSMTNRKLNLVGIRDTRHIYMTLVSECVHVWYLQRTFNVFDVHVCGYIFFPVLAGGCGVCMLISLWCCVFVCMHLSWCAVEGESINKLFEGCENFSMDWHVCRLFFFFCSLSLVVQPFAFNHTDMFIHIDYGRVVADYWHYPDDLRGQFEWHINGCNV